MLFSQICEEAAAAVLNSLSLKFLEDIGWPNDRGPLDGNWPFPLAPILTLTEVLTDNHFTYK